MTDESAAAGEAPLVHAIQIDRKPERVYRYRSVSVLGYAVLALGACYGLSLLTSIVFILGSTAESFQVAAGDAANPGLAVAILARLLFLMLTYVVAAFWIFNAACNARAFGAKGLQISPGWAVGWYFVPIMGLFKPFQGMEEIWGASVSPTLWQAQRTPVLLRFWWGAWLLTNLIGTVISRFDEMSLQAFGAAFDLVAVALFLTVVWQVTRMQGARPHEVAQVFA
jgi:hypothetical protein